MDFVLLNDERDRPERATSWLEFLLAPARLTAYLADLRAGRAHNPTAATLIGAFLDAAAAPLRTPLDPVAAAVRVVDTLRLPLAALEAALEPPVLWRLATAAATTPRDPAAPADEHALFWATLVPRVVVRAACDADVLPAIGTESSSSSSGGSGSGGVVFRSALPADAPSAAVAAAELRAHIARTEARTDAAARAFRGAAAWELARLHVLQCEYDAARALLEPLENSAPESSNSSNNSSLFEAVDSEACACLLALCRGAVPETGAGELALWRAAEDGASDEGRARLDALLVDDCVARTMRAPARAALECCARLPAPVRARVAALNDVRAALDDPAGHCYGAGDGGARCRAVADVLRAAEARGDTAAAARMRTLEHEAQLFAREDTHEDNKKEEDTPAPAPAPATKKARLDDDGSSSADTIAAFINAGDWDAVPGSGAGAACCALLGRLMRIVRAKGEGEGEGDSGDTAALCAVVPALLRALVAAGWDHRAPPLCAVTHRGCVAAVVSCAMAACCALQLETDTEDPSEWALPVLAPPRYAAFTEALAGALLGTLEGDGGEEDDGSISSSISSRSNEEARAQLGRDAAHVLHHSVQHSVAAGLRDTGTDAAAWAVLGDSWYERGQCGRAARAYLQQHCVATRHFTTVAEGAGPGEDDVLRLASALLRADEHLAAAAVLQLQPRVDHRLGVRTLDRIPAGRLALHRDTSLLPCFFDIAFLEHIDCLWFPFLSFSFSHLLRTLTGMYMCMRLADLVTEKGLNPRKHAFVTQIIGTDTINAHNRVSDEQRAQRALTVLAALHAHYVSWSP